MNYELSVFANDVFSVLDKIFKSDKWFYDFESFVPATMNIKSAIYSVPCDIYLKDNRNMVLEVALAGYKEDNITISFDGDFLDVVLKRGRFDEKEGKKYLIRGIKKSSDSIRICVPANKFKHAETTAILKDGLLTVEIPSVEKIEIKPIKIEKK
jgi:HSP20 family molecular chaperone IbpA